MDDEWDDDFEEAAVPEDESMLPVPTFEFPVESGAIARQADVIEAYLGQSTTAQKRRLAEEYARNTEDNPPVPTAIACFANGLLIETPRLLPLLLDIDEWRADVLLRLLTHFRHELEQWQALRAWMAALPLEKLRMPDGDVRLRFHKVIFEHDTLLARFWDGDDPDDDFTSGYSCCFDIVRRLMIANDFRDGVHLLVCLLQEERTRERRVMPAMAYLEEHDPSSTLFTEALACEMLLYRLLQVDPLPSPFVTHVCARIVGNAGTRMNKVLNLVSERYQTEWKKHQPNPRPIDQLVRDTYQRALLARVRAWVLDSTIAPNETIAVVNGACRSSVRLWRAWQMAFAGNEHPVQRMWDELVWPVVREIATHERMTALLWGTVRQSCDRRLRPSWLIATHPGVLQPQTGVRMDMEGELSALLVVFLSPERFRELFERHTDGPTTTGPWNWLTIHAVMQINVQYATTRANLEYLFQQRLSALQTLASGIQEEPHPQWGARWDLVRHPLADEPNMTFREVETRGSFGHALAYTSERISEAVVRHMALVARDTRTHPFAEGWASSVLFDLVATVFLTTRDGHLLMPQKQTRVVAKLIGEFLPWLKRADDDLDPIGILLTLLEACEPRPRDDWTLLLPVMAAMVTLLTERVEDRILGEKEGEWQPTTDIEAGDIATWRFLATENEDNCQSLLAQLVIDRLDWLGHARQVRAAQAEDKRRIENRELVPVRQARPLLRPDWKNVVDALREQGMPSETIAQILSDHIGLAQPPREMFDAVADPTRPPQGFAKRRDAFDREQQQQAKRSRDK